MENTLELVIVRLGLCYFSSYKMSCDQVAEVLRALPEGDL